MAEGTDSGRGFSRSRARAAAPRGAALPSADRALEVEHDGVLHRVAVKRVATARRFTLRVRASQRDVVLTMPVRGSSKAAAGFVHRNAAWIAERLAKLEPGVPFEVAALIPLRGMEHRLVRQTALRRGVWTEPPGEDGVSNLCVSAPSATFASAVHAYLRQQALRDLNAAVQRYATAVCRPVSGIRVADTRSRWGSCAATGKLSFSWRLILAPPLVLDYVAAHEVAHLVHLDHSNAFWTLTRKLAPRMDEAEAWLKRQGARLHRFGSD
jgi:predicted metal-dependent hydrolase